MTGVGLFLGLFVMTSIPIEPTDVWLPTSKAVAKLGLCRRTLHRWIGAGHLVIDEHFRKGLTPRSPLRWNVRAIEARIKQLRSLPNRPV